MPDAFAEMIAREFGRVQVRALNRIIVRRMRRLGWSQKYEQQVENRLLDRLYRRLDTTDWATQGVRLPTPIR